ncbi:hypothetical protein D7B24_000992 [Verticillium nonalfalfae]|uniref:Uncharacterized protein n=2 Tax=Verticillium TaxID=1036719 RepID=A0A444RUL7_VERDA|nr:uncharacterized protein D7B24_000992 [Verticillium nonalfalfae]PNH43021.1 hypothetical protein VD0004_g4393 [Verticillium dahliae]PNH73355.1 hypothetical protein VD0001_g4205 [Verticillium dahliae]RNJ54017.1 hypothetical protein D7B24_000992 [Verticillium nonalfalfae]RXG44852.1 hypothetical protein VDGE_30296 [Verticillium dahliae]
MDEFYADAIFAAKHTQDRDHLEMLLTEQRENRWKELKNSTIDVAYASCTQKQHFPSTAVKDAALDVGQTGSLSSFLHFIFCAMASWNNERNASDKRNDQNQPNLRKECPTDGVDDDRHGPGQLDGEDYGADS